MTKKVVPPEKPNNTQTEVKGKNDEENNLQAILAKNEKMRADELQALNAQVDSLLSANSEEFLQSVKQPGGE